MHFEVMCGGMCVWCRRCCYIGTWGCADFVEFVLTEVVLLLSSFLRSHVIICLFCYDSGFFIPFWCILLFLPPFVWGGVIGILYVRRLILRPELCCNSVCFLSLLHTVFYFDAQVFLLFGRLYAMYCYVIFIVVYLLIIIMFYIFRVFRCYNAIAWRSGSCGFCCFLLAVGICCLVIAIGDIVEEFSWGYFWT